ncbi:MAG TPA: kelch repeat-containing protein, partial [Candidatus Angelobacter sp.]|nr:kelch repeat-containing protein [Candidatus Angelobacter sp.]
MLRQNVHIFHPSNSYLLTLVILHSSFFIIRINERMILFTRAKQIRWTGCWRYQRLLSPYLDGELDQAETASLEGHLTDCDECRTLFEKLRFASRMVTKLSVREVEPATTPHWIMPAGAVLPLRQKRKPVFVIATIAASLVIASFAIRYFMRDASASWAVMRLSGRPTIGASPIARSARLHTGEWLETDSVSRALIQVGQLGQVEIDQRSRVRLVESDTNEYRLELARGRIYASVVAPPRLFQVETPSAVALDLGCAYTLDVDEEGGSLLHVTSGWVALAHNGRESLVPAGAVCRAKPVGQIGTPYFEDASAKFQQALARLDFVSDKTNALATVLAEARMSDALTLWQLLARVTGSEREQIYEQLVVLIPAARNINKTATLRLDRQTLGQWKEAIEYAIIGVDPRKIPVASGTVQPVDPMLSMRQLHTATLLPDGKVLIAGGGDRDGALASAELFDPATGSFSETGSMRTPRAGHEATLLNNGKVLITGGMSERNNIQASAELYDPLTRRFAPAGEMKIARESHRATLLNNGKVLITGGLSPSWPEQRLAEIYDPVTGRFYQAGEMTGPRADHTATLLPNGQVLLIAGSTGRSINEAVTQSAELFDPATSRFTETGSLAVPRHKHTALLLRDSKVLVIGGADSRLRGFYNSAELYDPVTGKFSPTGSMSAARYKIRDAAVLLADGKALVAGGGMRLEVYDPVIGIFNSLP